MSNKLVNTIAAKSMSTMYLESELADVHFIFPNDDQSERVPAHKAILASTSPVFKAMFFGPLKENDTVKITDSNTDAFKEFLQLFYLFEVTLSIGNIEEIVRLADKYDMLESCATLLEANITTENILWCYQFAIALNNAELKEFCESRIQKHIFNIIKSEKFLHCSRDVVRNILKLDTLDCDEIQLFNACIEWAKASCQKNGLDETNSVNLKNQLDSCFYLIRFSAMEAEEIADILQIKLIEGLFRGHELADIWRAKWTKKPVPELFSNKERSKPVYTWNATNILLGNRLLKSGSRTKRIHLKDSSVFFSSNEHILLGEIHFATISSESKSSKSCSINIIECIIDNAEDSEDSEDSEWSSQFKSSKSLYTKNYNEPPTLLSLDKPIVIQSHKVYQIRFTFSHECYASYLHYRTASEVSLNDKIKISFHPSPNDAAGFVSKLYFNQIE